MRWADGDTTDCEKKERSIRPCDNERSKAYFKHIHKKPLMSESFGVWEETIEEGTRRTRKPAQPFKDLERQSGSSEPNQADKAEKPAKDPWGKDGAPKFRAQKVLSPDVVVKHITHGNLKGQAGGFAARDIKPGTVISCYAGKLSLSSTLRQQAADMLVKETVAQWPPERGEVERVGASDTSLETKRKTLSCVLRWQPAGALCRSSADMPPGETGDGWMLQDTPSSRRCWQPTTSGAG